ncbi:tetraspanin-17 isoform X2 [Nycticebus coucang]|uniref:tetraspanin-17 isoform X2 n=1 Tax=Nycticebus coucang TaxID=9470 RepID=UPI00234DDD29|nr:tetraspanin-17 isoform X2 [Nycticebus coucang]
MPGKHQHFQEPEVGCCGKYFLFGFNIVFWVLGALFLAIGLWAWGEKGVLSNISALTDLGGLDPVWLFVVVGGVMSVLGFAGCIGALRENTFLLKFFSVFLGLIFFLELATGILAFVFKDWIRDQLNLFINNNVKAYRDDIDLQNLIDFAQEYWSCCGARGPNDWNLNIYFNCTDLNPSRERCGVPFSCCIRDPAEDVLNTQCGYDVRLKLIFGICLAQNLVSDIKAVKANWSTSTTSLEERPSGYTSSSVATLPRTHASLVTEGPPGRSAHLSALPGSLEAGSWPSHL